MTSERHHDRGLNRSRAEHKDPQDVKARERHIVDADLGIVDAWPKRCGCGCSYTESEWMRLTYVGLMIDDVESIELRNCSACGSTIAMTIDDDTA